jgi:hypothetical protein
MGEEKYSGVAGVQEVAESGRSAIGIGASLKEVRFAKKQNSRDRKPRNLRFASRI